MKKKLMKITTKKPVWSTWVWRMDGTGSVIHNYADGTNSGPLSVSSFPHYSYSYKRKFTVGENDPLRRYLEELDEDLG